MATPAGQPLEAPVPGNEQRGPVGLSFDQLLANVPRQPSETYGVARVLAVVVRSELEAGRIRVDERGHYLLAREKFPGDVLRALARLRLD